MVSTDSRRLDAVAGRRLCVLLHQEKAHRPEKSSDAGDGGALAFRRDEWNRRADLHCAQFQRPKLTPP